MLTFRSSTCQVVIFSILTLSCPDDGYAQCGGTFCFELRQQLAQKHSFSLISLWCHNCEGQTSAFTTISCLIKIYSSNAPKHTLCADSQNVVYNDESYDSKQISNWKICHLCRVLSGIRSMHECEACCCKLNVFAF